MENEQVIENVTEQVTEPVVEQATDNTSEFTPVSESTVDSTSDFTKEIELLRLENEQLKTQLAKAEFEKDEAQRAFLNKGNEVKEPRDFKSIVEDIE